MPVGNYIGVTAPNWLSLILHWIERAGRATITSGLDVNTGKNKGDNNGILFMRLAVSRRGFFRSRGKLEDGQR